MTIDFWLALAAGFFASLSTIFALESIRLFRRRRARRRQALIEAREFTRKAVTY